MKKKKIIGIIPARLSSTRLPNKVLLKIGDRPILWHVYNRAKKAKLLDDLIVACDDILIKKEMESFNIPCILTSKDCKSGTDRVAETAQTLKSDIYINIQGDEPFIHPANIDKICNCFLQEPEVRIVTLCTLFKDINEEKDPNNVKVVFDKKGWALYFSRSLIPFNRNDIKIKRFKHLGIYGYERETLLSLSKIPVSNLERYEKLEQLRFLEWGLKIRVIVSPYDSYGIDTKQDLIKARKIFKIQNKIRT